MTDNFDLKNYIGSKRLLTENFGLEEENLATEAAEPGAKKFILLGPKQLEILKRWTPAVRSHGKGLESPGAQIINGSLYVLSSMIPELEGKRGRGGKYGVRDDIKASYGASPEGMDVLKAINYAITNSSENNVLLPGDTRAEDADLNPGEKLKFSYKRIDGKGSWNGYAMYAAPGKEVNELSQGLANRAATKVDRETGLTDTSPDPLNTAKRNTQFDKFSKYISPEMKSAFEKLNIVKTYGFDNTIKLTFGNGDSLTVLPDRYKPSNQLLFSKLGDSQGRLLSNVIKKLQSQLKTDKLEEENINENKMSNNFDLKSYLGSKRLLTENFEPMVTEEDEIYSEETEETSVPSEGDMCEEETTINEDEDEEVDDSKWYKDEDEDELDSDINLDDYEFPSELAWEDNY